MRLVKCALSQLNAEKAAGRPVRLVRSAKLALAEGMNRRQMWTALYCSSAIHHDYF
jgi:hypothetical protein